MGNCLRRDSALQRGCPDWASSPVPDLFFSNSTRNYNIDDDEFISDQEKGMKKREEEGLLGSSSKPIKEVKIKISKKQLVELLGKVDMNELSVEQVLDHLMNISDGFQSDHRPWRPNLQSIPE